MALKKATGRKRVTILVIVLVFVFLFFGLLGYHYYRYLYQPNVILAKSEVQHLFIPTGSDFISLKSILQKSGFMKDMKAFEWVALRKGYPERVRAGRYPIRNGMSNNELVNMLRSGLQDPVRVTFNNIRTTYDLAGKISHQLEIDSAGFSKLMQDKHFLKKFDVTPQTVLVLFIPNTYEFFWNTTAEKFFKRMKQEQLRFWNRERLEKARSSGLSMTEVVTLASIVEKETAKDKEKPVIAGVYINRLRNKWPLQADPTLIFAWNDYSIKRVLNKHKEINSPYNTYIYSGLPPGPICLPSISSIESVLNYDKHKYMFFCSKEDLSGYHNFSSTLAQHNRYAEKYRMALQRLKIF